MRFPHCDQRILHSPEDGCQFCNELPEWQALRKVWAIAFTGHAPEHGQTACPADMAVLFGERGDYDAWGGNRREPLSGED